jgi:hypothetical protein
MMLHHVDASQVGTFKDAIDIKFAPGAIGILEPADTTPTEPIEPEPTAPTAPTAPVAPDTDPVIDVEVTTDTPTTDAPIAPAPAPTTTAATPTPDIEGLLNKMTIQSIRKLAATKKVSGHGTRAAIAGRLKAIITQADIWNATA